MILTLMSDDECGHYETEWGFEAIRGREELLCLSCGRRWELVAVED